MHEQVFLSSETILLFHGMPGISLLLNFIEQLRLD